MTHDNLPEKTESGPFPSSLPSLRTSCTSALLLLLWAILSWPPPYRALTPCLSLTNPCSALPRPNSARTPPSQHKHLRYACCSDFVVVDILLCCCFQVSAPILTLQLLRSDLITVKSSDLFSVLFQCGKSIRKSKVGSAGGNISWAATMFPKWIGGLVN